MRRCLESIVGICDEIVVVDTGSRDDTVAVAESFGALVHHRPWDDDFAAARNAALERATGEWILYIDADEQLEGLDADCAREELMAATGMVAIRIPFRARPMFSPYLEYRLWRHRDDIRFFGRIHETMVPDLLRVASETGLEIGQSEHFAICHWGYEGDQRHKHQRNLPLLEQRVVELPDRVYLWNHLGEVRLALGNPDGAEQAWREGVQRVRDLGLVDRTDMMVFGSLALHLIGKGEDVGDLLAEMQRLAPWFLTAHWVAALHHRAHGRHDEAVTSLRRLVTIGADPIDPSLAYDNGIFTDRAWDLLGDSLFQLGDIDGAAEVFVAAADARPESRSFRAKARVMTSYAATRRG